MHQIVSFDAQHKKNKNELSVRLNLVMLLPMTSKYHVASVKLGSFNSIVLKSFGHLGAMAKSVIKVVLGQKLYYTLFG